MDYKPVSIKNSKIMLEKFKSQSIQNPQYIIGGATQNDFIVEDDLDGL